MPENISQNMQYKYNKDDIIAVLHTLQGKNFDPTGSTCKLVNPNANSCENCKFERGTLDTGICALRSSVFPDYAIFLQENLPELFI